LEEILDEISSHVEKNPDPFESGRLTPLIVGIFQSGKLLCLCGLGLLLLVFVGDWAGIWQGPSKAK
jgi:hypothetical protein